jgi:hypothetical protein
MKVRVLKIAPGKPTAKGKDTYIFSYEENGQEKSTLIFDKSMIVNVAPGDLVDCDVEQRGKYLNVNSITVLEKAGPIQSYATGVNTPLPSSSYSKEDPEKQKNISRAVALDKAVVLVSAFGGKIPLDKAIVDVLSTADTFFKYLTGEDVVQEDAPPF